MLSRLQYKTKRNINNIKINNRFEIYKLRFIIYPKILLFEGIQQPKLTTYNCHTRFYANNNLSRSTLILM